jgi:hypothetical protein
VPRRRDFSSHVTAPDVAQHDGRVARLLRDGLPVGHLLVQTQPYAEVVAGHLWWRRWGPTVDALWLWTVVDGRFVDTMVTEPDLVTAELQMWGRAECEHDGEMLTLRWLEPVEAAMVASSVFGA